MPHFQVLNNVSDIRDLSTKWYDVQGPNFKSDERLVDEKGKVVAEDFNGRTYRLISKKERDFSSVERFGRGLLGVLAVVVSLGFLLFAKPVRNLFTKDHESKRFGVEVKDESAVENALLVEIDPNGIAEEQEMSIRATWVDGTFTKFPASPASVKRNASDFADKILFIRKKEDVGVSHSQLLFWHQPEILLTPENVDKWSCFIMESSPRQFSAHFNLRNGEKIDSHISEELYNHCEDNLAAQRADTRGPNAIR